VAHTPWSDVIVTKCRRAWSPAARTGAVAGQAKPSRSRHRCSGARWSCCGGGHSDDGPGDCRPLIADNPEHHDYELYLAVEDIDHTRTKTKSPQTNGICERFHRTVLDEFYRVAFRKKIYWTIDELQSDLDVWVKE
jgi:hypothetical protein